jgi:hypothetical protein
MRGCRFCFFSQLRVQIAAVGDEIHQAFRHVRVEAVDHEGPLRLGIGGDGSGDVGYELRFGARLLQRWADDLPCHHVQAGSQRRRPVPSIFEFLLQHAVGLGRLVGSNTLQGLQRSCLVYTHRMDAIGCLRRGLKVGSADIFDLGLELPWVLPSCSATFSCGAAERLPAEGSGRPARRKYPPRSSA